MGSCGSQGPPGAVAPAFPHPGDQAAYCSGLRAHSRPPGACPCAQGDPPSSWPCPGSLALCLPSPGPEGLVPARHPIPLWVRSLRFQLSARDASSVTLSPHVFLVPTPGVPQIPAPGRQRFSPTSGALPVLALDPPWLALLPFPPHIRCSPSQGLVAGLESRTQERGQPLNAHSSLGTRLWISGRWSLGFGCFSRMLFNSLRPLHVLLKSFLLV